MWRAGFCCRVLSVPWREAPWPVSPGAQYRDEYSRGEPLAHLAAAVAGFCVGWVYLRIGTSVEGGVRAGGMLRV